MKNKYLLLMSLYFCVIYIKRTNSVTKFKVAVVGINSTLDYVDSYSALKAVYTFGFKIAKEMYGIEFDTHYIIYNCKNSGNCSCFVKQPSVLREITELYFYKNISIIIGPICGAAIQQSSHFIDAYDLIMVTGSGHAMEDTRHLKTVVRTTIRPESSISPIINMLIFFQWNRIAMIIDKSDISSKLWGKILRKTLYANHFNRVHKEEYISGNLTETDRYEILDNVMFGNFQIIFILSSPKEFCLFVLQAMNNKSIIQDNIFFTHHWTYLVFSRPLFFDYPQCNKSQNRKLIESYAQSIFYLNRAEKLLPSSFYNYFEDQLRILNDEELTVFKQDFFDSIMYLTISLNQSLIDGDIENGDNLNSSQRIKIIQKFWNKSLPGLFNYLKINEDGDKVSMIFILHYKNSTKEFETVFEFTDKNFTSFFPIVNYTYWHEMILPTDIGDKNDLNENESFFKKYLFVICLFIGIFLMIVLEICVCVFYQKYIFKKSLKAMNWKIDYTEISDIVRPSLSSLVGSVNKNLSNNKVASFMSLNKQANLFSGTGSFENPPNAVKKEKTFTVIAKYKNEVVALRLSSEKTFETSDINCIKMKKLTEIRHANILTVFGACIGDKFVALVTEYCSKGSLWDLIQDKSVKLNWLFKETFIREIVKGMKYLHKSDCKVHGHLTSKNCLIGDNYRIKISHFNLPSEFVQIQDIKDDCYWKSPEILRNEIYESQEADVYSFGVICFEIIVWNKPFSIEDDFDDSVVIELDYKTIIKNIVNSDLFRPIFSARQSSNCPTHLKQITESCWLEIPKQRPKFSDIQKKLDFNYKDDIFDIILNRVEKYTSYLERSILIKSDELIKERKRADRLLYQVLPKTVAEILKRGDTVPPEEFDCVTIFNSDVVNFTKLASLMTPMDVVNFLNDLYTCFDFQISLYDVYKVATIGDGCIIVSGLPVLNGCNHAKEIASLSLDILKEIEVFQIKNMPNYKLQIRIGLHSGPCVAGIVGSTMPRYCLFGETVIISGLAESSSKPGKIHVTESLYKLLIVLNSYEFQSANTLKLKGKANNISTYWLVGMKERCQLNISESENPLNTFYTDSTFNFNSP